MNRKFQHKRRPIPSNLPVERTEIDLPDDRKPCPCCGAKRIYIGFSEPTRSLSQLYRAMGKRVLQSYAIHADEPPLVLLQSRRSGYAVKRQGPARRRLTLDSSVHQLQ